MKDYETNKADIVYYKTDLYLPIRDMFVRVNKTENDGVIKYILDDVDIRNPHDLTGKKVLNVALNDIDIVVFIKH